MTHRPLVAASLLLSLAFAACRDEDRTRGDAAAIPPGSVGAAVEAAGDGGVPHVVAGSAGAPPTTHVGPPHDTADAGALTWSVARIETRLRDAGLAVTRDPAEVRQPFMSVPGSVLRVPGAEVQAYVYADPVARARDTDRLDPARVAPPTMMVTWREPASLVVDNNLALIVIGRDPAARARIRAAVAAVR